MIDAAEKLNTLRNRLAHHLDPPQIEVLVRDFLLLCEEPNDPAVPLIRRLKRAIVYVCAVFEASASGGPNW
jgi:hypothetical protein